MGPKDCLETNHSAVHVSDIAKLHHMLGTSCRQPGFLNYYCAAESDDQAMGRLVNAGLVEHRGGNYYRATALGCKLVGLGPAAIKLALGGE
jgi:hypothetical protein